MESVTNVVILRIIFLQPLVYAKVVQICWIKRNKWKGWKH